MESIYILRIVAVVVFVLMARFMRVIDTEWGVVFVMLGIVVVLLTGCESDGCEPATFRCKPGSETVVQICNGDGDWEPDGDCADWDDGLVCKNGDCEEK